MPPMSLALTAPTPLAPTARRVLYTVTLPDGRTYPVWGDDWGLANLRRLNGRVAQEQWLAREQGRAAVARAVIEMGKRTS